MVTSVIPFENWLSDASPDTVIFTGPDVTRSALKRMASEACRIAAESGARRIAVSFETPSLFFAAFYGILAAGCTPVIFPFSRKGTAKYAGEYDAVMTDRAPDSSDVPAMLWHGEESSGPLPEIQEDAAFLLFTSGSSGKPKRIRKTVLQMNREAEITSRLFRKEAEKAASLFTTADASHLYGMSFAVWFPLSLGIPVENRLIRFPEELSGIRHSFALITTPTFLKHLDTELPGSRASFVLSAGGVLSEEALHKSLLFFSAPVHEIYGSTETGVIASRVQNGKDITPPAELIPGAELRVQQDGAELVSPLLSASFRLDDRIRLLSPRAFLLLGRCDRVIKIGEQRLSLTEVERETERVTGRKTAAAAVETAGRTVIGAVLEGDAFSAAEVRRWRLELQKKLDPLAVPRLWRHTAELPENARGKTDSDAILELFR